MRTIRIPTALHEVLGSTQTTRELWLVGLGAAGLTSVLCIAGAETLAAIPAWRAVLAVVLIADIAAGAIANLTAGTDRHYASSARRRWLFIAVHWHLVALAALLGAPVVPMLVVTVLALAAAAAVTLLHGRYVQVAAGGALLVAGLVATVLWLPGSAPPILVATTVMFLVKVVFAFAVTHHRQPPAAPVPTPATERA